VALRHCLYKTQRAAPQGGLKQRRRRLGRMLPFAAQGSVAWRR
jgi:hypothetical protein